MSDDPRTREIGLLRQRVLDLESENIALRQHSERLEQLRAELTLSDFVDSLALATTLGEASMPDRVISSLAIEARSYLVPANGGLGLRFQPPELAERPRGLSTTSLELAKIPGLGAHAAPSLYNVFEAKQRLYTGLSAEAAAQVVLECTKALAESGSWSIPFLAGTALRIGEGELTLAGSVADPAYSDAARALVELAQRLSAKARPVAGDVYSLAAALDGSTQAAKTAI